MIDMRKIYNFYPIEGEVPAGALPTGAELYYECLDCEKVVSSIPHIKVACACGNLHGAKGRVSVERPERVRVVRGVLK